MWQIHSMNVYSVEGSGHTFLCLTTDCLWFPDQISQGLAECVRSCCQFVASLGMCPKGFGHDRP